jgi:tRNA modification GTPase
MQHTSCICALATPPGVSGLAVIRISGQDCFSIVDKVFRGKSTISSSNGYTVLYGTIQNNDQVIDNVTCTVFRTPHSYTGEDTVEIGCHGGYIVYNLILTVLLEHGARHAEPGEFTKRAFLNGKMDLTQVESVADLIHSHSVKSAQVATNQLRRGLTNRLSTLRQYLIEICGLLELELDFSQEDLEFVDKSELCNRIVSSIAYCQSILDDYKGSEILRSGFTIGLVGFPNAGKSSLFNTLLGKNRSIVSSIAGTTRDYIDESFTTSSLSFRLIDTAGLRDTDDTIEIEGIRLSHSILQECHLILLLNDISLGISNSTTLYESLLNQYPASILQIVHTKADLVNISSFPDFPFLVSSLSDSGISELKSFIQSKAIEATNHISDYLLNSRHQSILSSIVTSLNQALVSLQDSYSNEFVALDIRSTIQLINELTGDSWSEEILNSIFSKFCIGK